MGNFEPFTADETSFAITRVARPCHSHSCQEGVSHKDDEIGTHALDKWKSV